MRSISTRSGQELLSRSWLEYKLYLSSLHWLSCRATAEVDEKCFKQFRHAVHAGTGRNDATGRCLSVLSARGDLPTKYSCWYYTPFANLASRRRVKCHYSQKEEGHRIIESLRKRLTALERFISETEYAADSPEILPISRLGREIAYEVPYPVSKRWYFPMLLHFSMVYIARNWWVLY